MRMLVPRSEAAVWREIADAFQKKSPDVKILIDEGPDAADELGKAYLKSFAQKEGGYELIYTEASWTAEFTAQGALTPLDGYFSSEALSHLAPGEMNASYYSGRVHRIPVTADAGALFFRRDSVGKAPSTWSELEEAALRFQRPPNVWGFVFAGAQDEELTCVFIEALAAGGGAVFGRGNEVTLGDPRGAEALETLSGFLYDSRITPPEVLDFGNEAAMRFFESGGAVFMRNRLSVYAKAAMKRRDMSKEIAVAPLPGLRGGGTAAGWGIGISPRLKKKEAALRFVNFAAGEEAQRKLAPHGIIPALDKARAALPKGIFAPGELDRILGDAVTRPARPDYRVVSRILRFHAANALLREAEPADSVAGAVREIENLSTQKINTR